VTTVIVGLDPGGAQSGYGVLDVGGTPAQPVFTCLATGEIESSGEALDAFLSRCDPFQLAAGRIIAVERVGGHGFAPGRGGARVASLMAASEIAGLFIENARGRGCDVVPLTARQWRHVVVGDPSPEDATIKIVIQRLVRALPKLTNSHNRDALGLAVAVALGARGQRSPVETSLTKKERVRRALKKARA
jgi:Holliday junction resolvasome RuvABC endonuclease subunit